MLREGKRTGTTYELSRVPAGTPRRDHDLVGLLEVGQRDLANRRPRSANREAEAVMGLQKRLGQKLGAPRGDAGGSSADSTTRDLPAGRAPAELRRRTGRSQEGRRAGSGDPIIGARQGGPELWLRGRGEDVMLRHRSTRDAAAPAGAAGPSTGIATAGTIYGKHPGAVPAPVAHTSQDPRQARTAAVRPDARGGHVHQIRLRVPRRLADARACRRYPCSVPPERFCARGRFAGTYSPGISGFLLPPGHGYQWHSCHKKCWICRQNMHRRP